MAQNGFVNNGETAANNGAQLNQHGSGAMGAMPTRDDATGGGANPFGVGAVPGIFQGEASGGGGGVDWAGVFAQHNAEPGETGAKRSKGVDGGRSRSPLLGKFGRPRRGVKSPMVIPRSGGVKESSNKKEDIGGGGVEGKRPRSEGGNPVGARGENKINNINDVLKKYL